MNNVPGGGYDHNFCLSGPTGKHHAARFEVLIQLWFARSCPAEIINFNTIILIASLAIMVEFCSLQSLYVFNTKGYLPLFILFTYFKTGLHMLKVVEY